ncbi:hypothetical protein [Immundisolibacter cernigliae]|uniref:Uncharacterized protein n=1 Tax=Immundisolibacter cernigliae TaxID=1810504 RepID=A0A1B1YSY2_9GAMM|nr:hypothetical protein [Immundisolibacter cernigliae]ANX03763.1 hypothetical protein PG2T_05855 [Immundisolibacter cernigliae]
MTEQRFGLTEGLVIAGVPAAGYWFAFLYESGYCKYFYIPSFFIEISILNILVATIGMVGALALINLYADPLFMLLSGVARPIRDAILRASIPLIVTAGYALVAHFTLVQFLTFAGAFFVPIAFGEFIFPLLTQRSTEGYVNKLEAQNKKELELDNLIDLVANAIGRRTFLFLALLLALSFVAYFAGGYEAKTQRDFMVIGEKADKVVLKTIGGHFLIAEFDREAKSLSTKFSLVSLEQDGFEFNYERIGPLVPAGVK